MTPILRLCQSRTENDCGIVALVCITGASYEDVLRAVCEVDPKHQGRNGLWVRQLEDAARKLGCPLRRRRKYDLDEDTGLLSLSMETPPDHIVLLVRGTVYESDGTLWEPDVFLKHRKATPGVLLVPASD